MMWEPGGMTTALKFLSAAALRQWQCTPLQSRAASKLTDV